MILWIVLGAMALLAFGVILVALLRPPRKRASRAEHDLEVFRAQLRELEREVERGVLNEAEAESARLEVQRRLLAADTARRRPVARTKSPFGRAAAALIALAVPVAAVGLYLLLGSPELASLQVAQGGGAGRDAGAGHANMAEIETMMTRLEQRLADRPDDLQGWIILGRSLLALGRYQPAIKAFDRAIALNDGIAFVHAARGEAMVSVAEGKVTPEARAAFRTALGLDPNNAAARFYLAEAREQDGDSVGALDDMIAMLRDAPADAAWYDTVRERAQALASGLGLDPKAELPARPNAASEDPAKVAERLSASLAKNPKDFRGWIALARARAALGDPEGARDALRLGSEAFPGAPFVQQQFQSVAAELGLPLGAAAQAMPGPSSEDVKAAGAMSEDQRNAMIRTMVTGLAERLKDRPDDLEGWRMLARSYGVLGEPEKAIGAFRHLAERQPQDAGAQLDYARALLTAGGEGAPASPEAVAALKRVLELDDKNRDALYYLGDAAARRGDAAGASRYWRQLLALLPADSRERDMVRDRLDRLEKGKKAGG